MRAIRPTLVVLSFLLAALGLLAPAPARAQLTSCVLAGEYTATAILLAQGQDGQFAGRFIFTPPAPCTPGAFGIVELDLAVVVAGSPSAFGGFLPYTVDAVGRLDIGAGAIVGAVAGLAEGLANAAAFQTGPALTPAAITLAGAAVRTARVGRTSTALGLGALAANTNGINNTAVGASTLAANTTGFSNTALGARALDSNTTGSGNTGLGHNALGANTTGGSNTAVGPSALQSNTTGFGNSALGFNALADNTTGSNNTAVGGTALANTTGFSNTAVGFGALLQATSGNANIALGSFAGANVTTGSNNIYVGHAGLAGDGGTTRIGASLQTSTFIAGIRGVTTGLANAIPVLIDSQGQLGTTSSSHRVKTDIHDMAEASHGLLRLRPVSFRYRHPAADGARPLQYGRIAEEVAEVFPELVAYTPGGQPETVFYHLLPAMLLNELQRQHREVEALRVRQAELEARLAELAGGPAERAPAAAMP